jgi:DNA-binding response OmpR family regulator
MKQVSILLVSGKKDDYQYIEKLLSHAKNTLFCIEWADSSDAGQRALSKKHYDIALVEDDLGIMRGSQFIQKAEKNGIRVPIILFTCSECWEADEAAFQSDAVYCLVRDKITPARLEEIILKELNWKITSSFLQF